MKKVRFLMTIQGVGFGFHRGDEETLDNATAKSYKAQGIVEILEDIPEKKAPAPPATEKAELEPKPGAKPKPTGKSKKATK